MKRKGVVDAIVVANKAGLSTYKAKVFIDCTGDGDLAAWAVLKVHGEIAVHVFARFGFVQEPGLYPGIVQLVMHFAYLDQKVAPLLVVEREHP